MGKFRYIVTGVVKAPVKIARSGYGADDKEAQNYVAYMNKFPAAFLTIDEKVVGKLKGVTLSTKTLNLKPALRYLRSPDLLRYDIISTSVIDQKHKATYFPWGFILRVPPENIISGQRNFRDGAGSPR